MPTGVHVVMKTWERKTPNSGEWLPAGKWDQRYTMNFNWKNYFFKTISREHDNLVEFNGAAWKAGRHAFFV